MAKARVKWSKDKEVSVEMGGDGSSVSSGFGIFMKTIRTRTVQVHLETSRKRESPACARSGANSVTRGCA